MRTLGSSFNPLLYACLFLLVAASTPASTIHQTWQVDTELIAVFDGESLARLVASGYAHTEVADRPALPLQPLSLAIPAGERVLSVRLENPVTDSVNLSETLPVFQGAANDEDGITALTSPPSGAFSRGASLPVRDGRLSRLGQRRDRDRALQLRRKGRSPPSSSPLGLRDRRGDRDRSERPLSFAAKTAGG